MSGTIKLSHKELVDLIVESIVEVKEQDRMTSPEQFREVIKNIEKLYGPKKDNSKGEEEVTEQRIGYDTYFDRQYGGGNSSSSSSVSASDSWYHYVIDAISFIAYLLCGFSAGVGCVVSVVADICNALLYVYTKDDYYSAGMQLAFAVVPGGEALKYAAKPLKTRSENRSRMTFLRAAASSSNVAQKRSASSSTFIWRVRFPPAKPSAVAPCFSTGAKQKQLSR